MLTGEELREEEDHRPREPGGARDNFTQEFPESDLNSLLRATPPRRPTGEVGGVSKSC